MTRKLIKTLLSTALSAALMVGATAVTAFAAENAESACSHSWYILDDYYYTYEYIDGDNHNVSGWEERYCRDCGAYFNVSVDKTEGHSDNGTGVCDCGHHM